MGLRDKYTKGMFNRANKKPLTLTNQDELAESCETQPEWGSTRGIESAEDILGNMGEVEDVYGPIFFDEEENQEEILKAMEEIELVYGVTPFNDSDVENE